MSWQAHENLSHDATHARPKNLNPKTNGPFLDDIRAEQERAYREARTMQMNAQAEKNKEPEPEDETPEDDSNDTETADAASVADDDGLELDLLNELIDQEAQKLHDELTEENGNDNASDGK